MQALSDHLFVGSPDELGAAVTRSHLGDGRCVGWFGSLQAGHTVVIDAELADQPVPPSLAARYGAEDFWARWTAMECGTKHADVPVAIWLRRHGLPVRAAFVEVQTVVGRGIVVSHASRRSSGALGLTMLPTRGFDARR